MSQYPRPHELTAPLSTTEPTQITFGFPSSAIQRIASKVADARLPTEPILQGVGWQYGSNLTKLRQLVGDWSMGNPAGSAAKSASSSGEGQGFEAWWQKIEAQINETANHYLVEIEGLRIHFQMRKSENPDAIPLLFSHGWPGSFYEAHRLFPLLTGDSSPSFHLVAPSLPGYGLSSAPTKPDWTLLDTSRVLHKLMHNILGFSTYAAHGGDLGTMVTRGVARNPECTAFHSNFLPPTNMPIWATPAMALQFIGWNSSVSDYSLGWLGNPHEIRLLKSTIRYRKSGSAYGTEQGTKPATLGLALFDNPVGILSWFLQVFHEWSDPRAPAFHDGHSHARTTDQLPGASVEGDGVGRHGQSSVRLGVSESSAPVNRDSAISDETILVNATIYALTDSIQTSFLPYYESEFMWPQIGRDKEWNRDIKGKPYGHSSFPYELAGGPRSWISRCGVNLVFYREHDQGGHFAALDNSEGLARDLKDFFNEHYKRA
ncbi:unnamed protein product [Tilletia laevis]|uniref:Epoxide hydrolase N-terminal domain-containing protein n=4 Tax=Tilletia TaxID=13289 RepID=A0A8X7ST48_9BASI|nr:hypothetical protein CF336_g7790 [Tilletia laevis]KAE8184759.1 hypothetical protein CF328_g7757 [Tilletia controversa]CAD6886387.1 unnamed protein product [Tilletia caries]KAE8188948.1 hypothetical protein CF335_g6751 [Tilletia laevis]KAE8239141.1 hypothetical protein A4X06_0g8488 [Tilletia controversa]